MKVLLSSVFGPYGVDDEYGRRLNVMELFHNQVTREQGLFSLRMNHPSFGLYLIAENLEAPTAVLDFPSFDRFKKEVKKGYDIIGISFIVANLAKAKAMAEYIRKVSPNTTIVLGGHGTGLSNVQELVPCDYVCKGEGVAFFRALLKEDATKPIKHPAIISTLNRKIMGVPLSGTAAVLIPGLGCVNACRFCATSHHFQKKYMGFLNTGKELFDTLTMLEKKLKVNEFFVMDENFLKNRIRAEEFMKELIEHDKFFFMGVFSSAETVQAVGAEFLVKLGIDFIWIGVESKKDIYAKTKGVDLKTIIAELRSYGIQVLGSGILFLEHHTKETIFDDIRYLIDLETDFVQFMELGPLPGTALYEDYLSSGKLRLDVPFEDWHGQDKIWFDHEHFTRDETAHYTKLAFSLDYAEQGPSLLRLADTSLRGYRKVRGHGDARIRKLEKRLKERCLSFYPLFPACLEHAENQKTIELIKYLVQEFAKEFGPPGILTHFSAFVVKVMAAMEANRLINPLYMPQPGLQYKTYRMSWAEKLAASFSRSRDSKKKSAKSEEPKAAISVR